MVDVPATTVHRSKLCRFSKIRRQCLGDGTITRVRLRAFVSFGGGKSVIPGIHHCHVQPYARLGGQVGIRATLRKS